MEQKDIKRVTPLIRALYLGREIQHKDKCKLNNEELASKAEDWLTRLINTGGRDWNLPVPANPEKDVDLVFSVLIQRFKEINSSNKVFDIDFENISRAAESTVKRWPIFEEDDKETLFIDGFIQGIKYVIDSCVEALPTSPTQP